MRQLRIRPIAETDIKEASDWYDERENGLGGRFLDELGATLTRIRLIPRQFPDVGRGLRRALLGRFPYAVYFVLRDEERISVIAVLHQKRNPATWKRRFAREGKAG